MFNLRVHLADSFVVCGFGVLGAWCSNWVCQVAPVLLGTSKQVALRFFFFFAIFKGQGEQIENKAVNGDQLFFKVQYLRLRHHTKGNV